MPSFDEKLHGKEMFWLLNFCCCRWSMNFQSAVMLLQFEISLTAVVSVWEPSVGGVLLVRLTTVNMTEDVTQGFK